MVSPASPVLDPGPLFGARTWLEGLGYDVLFTTHFNRRWGYAAGSPEERARDLESALRTRLSMRCCVSAVATPPVSSCATSTTT